MKVLSIFRLSLLKFPRELALLASSGDRPIAAQQLSHGEK